MTTHVSIDCETLSVEHDAAVVSIGICGFEVLPFRVTICKEIKISLESAMHYGSCSASTLRWWMKQEKKVQDALYEHIDDVSVPSALMELTEFVRLHEPELFWFNGPAEDAQWLRHLYKKCGLPLPWKHYQACDLRTIRYLARQVTKPLLDTTCLVPMVAHNALSDAVWQAGIIAACYKELTP